MKKILLFILIILLTGCTSSIDSVDEYKEVLGITNKDLVANISEYTIYGKYFNLKGTINYQDSFDNMYLAFKSVDYEIEYDLYYEESDVISFKTTKYINEGINLEKIYFDNYVVLLKIVNGNKEEYFNLVNASNYKDLEYYTLTRNNKNNYINILFSKYHDYNFLKVLMKENTTNKDICDIVLDPGHGGTDPGAVNGKYLEKDFNLVYAKMLQSELEDMGLKVKLTRESDILPSHYGVGSRTSLANECYAKLMLSLHLNSTDVYMKNGGVEIYMANGDSTTFPKVLADNIVKNTSSTYSSNPKFRVINGVHMRTYSNLDINETKKEALKNNWTPYPNMTTDTTYYYFIRETGGIITGAMTDGRNPKYDANPYYNSNHGTEAYLVELGYISSSSNLKLIINEKEKYVKGLIESIKYYLDN